MHSSPHTHTSADTQINTYANTPPLHTLTGLALALTLINWCFIRHYYHSDHNSTFRNSFFQVFGHWTIFHKILSYYCSLGYSCLNFFTSHALVKRRESQFVRTAWQVVQTAYMEWVCVPINSEKRCRASSVKGAFKMNGLHFFLSYWL